VTWMVSEVFLNPFADYAVILGFVIYCAVHQATIDRVLRRNQTNIGFGDKLLLFRVPNWHASTPLADVVLMQANRLAWQFVLGTSLVILYFVTATVVVFFA
jgi:hypothetical protein